ncbi:MAG: hypothetical protein VXZ38_13275 [Planctomycetota bacterium]|nr:hypothetical protein [Planctomycetota bacterium]
MNIHRPTTKTDPISLEKGWLFVNSSPDSDTAKLPESGSEAEANEECRADRARVGSK